MTEGNVNQPGTVQRPAGVTILSVLMTVTGIMWIIYPFVYTILFASYMEDLYGYIPWANVMMNGICCWIMSWIVASLYFGTAGGMMKGMPSSKMMAILLSIIALFNIPVGTIPGIISMIYLFKDKDVQAWFEQGAPLEAEMMAQMQEQQKK